MPKRDLFLALAAAFLVGLFAIPTLLNTGAYSKIPLPLLQLFLGLPILVTFGMLVAYLIGGKIALLWQVAKFSLVGVLNTAIDFGILNFLSAIFSVTKGFGIVPVNAASVAIAVVNSFYWNKEWVFATKREVNFVTFTAVTLIGLSINTGIVYFLTTFVSPILMTSEALWANLAKVLATSLSLVWNFLGYKLIVFRR